MDNYVTANSDGMSMELEDLAQATLATPQQNVGAAPTLADRTDAARNTIHNRTDRRGIPSDKLRVLPRHWEWKA